MASTTLLKRALVITLASVVILAGLLVGGVRLIDHLVPGYREALAERIGRRIDADIDIQAIELRWQWNGPLLELADVRVTRHGFDQPAVTLDSLGLHFSFTDLVNGKRLPDGLTLEHPTLTLRRGDDGRPRLAHWSRPGDAPLDWDTVNERMAMLRSATISDADITLLDERLPDGRGRIERLDAHIARGENGGYGLQFNLDGLNWLEHAQGQARFAGRLPTVDTAEFEFSVEGLDTPALARSTRLIEPALRERLTGGRLAATVDGRWQQGQLINAEAQIDLAAIADTATDADLLPALSATFEAAGIDPPAEADAGGDDIRLAMTAFDGDAPGLDRFTLTGAIDVDEPRLRIDARHVPVAIATRLARLRIERLADTTLDARVDDLALTVGADTPMQLAVDFKDLSIDDPAITAGPLAGSYYQQGDNHILKFNNAGGTLSARRYLRGELAVDDVDGEIAWQRHEGGWQIDARRLELASAEARLTSSGRIQLRPGQAPVVDLHASASAPQVARLLARIPQADDLPNEKLRDWLPKAITAGTLDNATLDVRGPMDRFPFAKPRGDERFHLELTGHDVDVTYKEDWPPLQAARGKLVLDGDDLRVDVAAARMLDVDLGPATGRVENVREPVLVLDGKARNARAEKMLAFLVRSPLRDRFAKIVDALKVTGPADLSLDLRIPLKSELGEPSVAGDVVGRGATLRTAALPGPITDITGTLHFDDERGLSARGLQGNLLGVALNADVVPVAGQRQRIVSRARLQLPQDGAAVAHYLPESWLRYGRGASDFSVAFEVARNGQVSDIDLKSDLRGLALDLPEPLNKPADRAAPLAITVAGDASRVHVGYDGRVDTTLRLRDGAVTRIQALLNDRSLTPPDQDGIWIGGQADHVDGLGWFTVVSDQVEAATRAAAESGSSAPALDFIGGDMKVGALAFDNRYFQNTHLRAQTMNARPGWRIDFEGPDTQGQVTWTQPTGGNINIAGNLARLALRTRPSEPATEPVDTSPIIWQDIDPADLPHLDVFVANFEVDDTDFGQAEVMARAQPDGWQLDRFQLKNGAMAGWATGRWVHQNGQTEASAQTRFEGAGMAGLLRTLGYPASVNAESTRLHARLHIAPNPAGLDLRALDGHVELALDNGTFTAVEPGAARVLGLVNLYVLPRRLRLDFRDVVDEGLAFDKVRANFRIENGDAYSDNVRIDTPSSQIRMSGRIGLAARDYDERVTIVPKVGSGVTVASTVLGGPLVGAAVFAMQELFKKPIKKFSSIAYTLKGSWDNPRIEQPSAEE
ncbi:YhdP family protein [Salinisphaera sp.]|uniref:YhdP family protein n=1 Tax=Salinisphaera sp. TaxID=1914330 RepID=UPI000C654EE1|nr:YhdP family protein [Salinisphaera sp.]MBS62275.1 TIGR02099 family protein [Salinisphaera sp.]